MVRKNFYILLDLSINPPEDDQKIIELTIKKKQAEWSRFRSHPTKGLKAKQYIDLLPEIRRIMSDPELRKTEASNATKFLLKKAGEKFSVIDRHIAICMSKGFITDEEIFNLAKRHSVKANEIRKRIKQKEDEKNTKINKQLKLRCAKGYITKDELSELAEIHSVSAKEIRKRVTCPIKKNLQKSAKKPKHLDKAIEKIITDNLKIVGKSSLYQFLDLPSDSSLETLQKKSKKKESELHKRGKKDALGTAGIALTGHCLTVFKTENNRNSYDITNARSLLKVLDSDIDVAGMDGTIRAEYYNVLVDSAVKLGMNKNEAHKYIKDYSRKKKWEIETKEKRPAWILYTVVITALLFIVASIYLHIKNESKLKKEYQQVLADIANNNDLQKKALALNNYISTHKESDRTIGAVKRLEKLRLAIDELKAKEFTADADKLLSEKKYQNALAIYKEFISKYPKSLYADKIKKKIVELSALLDDIDYKELDRLQDKPVQVRALAYSAYLKEHPKGKNIKNAKKILSNMREEYYLTLLKEIAKCEKNEDWEKGVLLCDDFIKIYKGHEYAVGIKEQQDILRTRLWEKETFARMLEKVKNRGGDYQAGRQIFVDYLKAYPDSYINDKIKVELANLDKKELTAKTTGKKERLIRLIKKSGSRFILNRNNTVKDKKTGLTWCVADSLLDTDDCLYYDSAIEYVNNLKTGGYNDWRLPTAAELAQIYKQQPFFPKDESEWYWTSKSYSRYADGWSKVVDIVTSKNEEIGQKEQRDSRDCGSVRAVR
ncbi:MAG: DUF1566 domain-containing protein [Deltaproteobacteria bacterium]|nr:DUF1566 domain-containing protein [Deltaproteobacteria bacterium]